MNPLLRPADVAEIFDTSTRTVLRWAASGELASIRVGKVVRFRAADVEAFVEAHAERGERSADVVPMRGGAAQ